MMKQLTVRKGGMAVEMPDSANALGFDPNAKDFSYRDVMPKNYWAKDDLIEKKQTLGGWPVFTCKSFAITQVYDKSKYQDGDELSRKDAKPKIVLHFVEAVPALVMNITRCEQMKLITGTSNPALWDGWASAHPRVVLRVGNFNKRHQIGIESVSETPPPPMAKPKAKALPDDSHLFDESLEDFNADFF